MTKAKPERGSKEHIRYHLKGYLGTYCAGGAGVVLRDDGAMIFQGKPFGVYKYFEGVEAPVFAFTEPEIEMSLTLANNRFPRPHFNFELSKLGQLSITAGGYHQVAMARPIIMDALRRLDIGIRARMRVVCDDKTMLHVEFWEPKHAQACLDYVNKHYEAPVVDGCDESRRYPAYWQDKEVFYAVGEVTYRVRVVPRVQVRTNGHVDVEGGRLQMFHYDEGGSFQFTLHNSGLSEKLKKGVDSGNRLE